MTASVGADTGARLERWRGVEPLGDRGGRDVGGGGSAGAAGTVACVPCACHRCSCAPPMGTGVSR